MMTSKERAAFRAQANTLDVTLMLGKGGVSDAIVQEASKLLDAHELVKGRVLEAALLTAREAQDALCEALGADGISVAGNTFVIYRKSEKLEQARKQAAKPKAAPAKKKVNPVKLGVKARQKRAKQEKERRQQYFHDAAVKAAIERRKQRESEEEF